MMYFPALESSVFPSSRKRPNRLARPHSSDVFIISSDVFTNSSDVFTNSSDVFTNSSDVFTSYSPLARGLLAGLDVKQLDPNDWRQQVRITQPPLTPCLARRLQPQVPRHSTENMAANAALLSAVHELARVKACTPSQISLAWLLAQVTIGNTTMYWSHYRRLQGSDIIPLVGTKTVARLEENAAALAVQLTEEDLALLAALPPLKVRGSKALFVF
jgi:aryl-alcohol dehydrogenase-like predicted oxidoreductase